MDQRSFYKAFYTNFLLFLSFLILLFSISTWSSPSFDGARIRAQAPSSFLFVYPRPFFGLSLPVIHLWYIITASLSYYSTKMPSLGLLLVWNMCKMWMFLFCHLIARPSTPDFLGKVGFNIFLPMTGSFLLCSTQHIGDLHLALVRVHGHWWPQLNPFGWDYISVIKRDHKVPIL